MAAVMEMCSKCEFPEYVPKKIEVKLPEDENNENNGGGQANAEPAGEDDDKLIEQLT